MSTNKQPIDCNCPHNILHERHIYIFEQLRKKLLAHNLNITQADEGKNSCRYPYLNLGTKKKSTLSSPIIGQFGA